MPRSPRLLIFGIDGLGARLLDDSFAAESLPHLASLAADGCARRTRCTWPPHTATGWPSLFLGRLPGEHGLFQFWDCQDPEYRLRVVGADEAGVTGLWRALAAAGWSLGRVNLPMSHPGDDLPGYEITWPLVPTLHYIRPPSLGAELLSAGGHVQPDIACMFDGREDYPSRALGFVRARTRSLLHLLTHHPVDAVAVVYSELDRVCHHYWSAFDPSHPRHAAAEPRLAGVIPAVLAEIDNALGELLAAVDDDCTVLVVSDHGFGPGHQGVRLHHLLAQGGFCRVPDTPPATIAELPDRELERSGRLPALDWEHTTAYMPAPGSFAVNLNLVGRQSQGTVQRSDFDATLERVGRFLLEQRDPATGRPVFSAAVPGRRAYAGPFEDRAPDLLLVPSSPSLMLLCDLEGATWSGPGQEGLHRMEGVWLLRSREIDASGSQLDREPIAIESVATDLLDRLGVESPSMPHRHAVAPGEAMERAGLPADAWSQAADGPRPGSAARPGELLSPAHPREEVQALDEPEIKRRLQQMGYL